MRGWSTTRLHTPRRQSSWDRGQVKGSLLTGLSISQLTNKKGKTITDGPSGAKVPRVEIVFKFRKEIPIETLVGLKKIKSP